MHKSTILFLVLSLVFTNVFIPISAGAEEMVYVSPAPELTDIDNHWASESVYALVNIEILSGYPDKTFKPDNQVTRAEYLTSLFKTVCILDESITSEYVPDSMGNFYFYGFRENERREFLKNFAKAQYEPSYNDLENHWSKNYVAWVKNYCDKKEPDLFKKIFPGESFYPDQPITREEAVLVTTAFMTPPVRSRGIGFKDVTPEYAFYDEIMNLVNNGIINGFPDGTFKPKENITRAATAVIMTNVLKEIAYNMDFFANPDIYLFTIGSSNDGDYVATFMTEDMYQNPPTELDKKYVAEFKAYELDRQLAQELMTGVYLEAEAQGYEYGTDEYEEKLKELENAVIEKYEKIKREEIPYYEPEKDRLEVLKELEQEDYWNKAGLYYWMYKLDPKNSIEYLKKAEAAYSIDKNGKDDLYKVYEEFILYYVLQEKNNQKAIEYIDKAYGLFVPNEYGEAIVANMQDIRFYAFAAYWLARLGEYDKALYYVEKLFDDTASTDVVFGTHFALERGILMYLCGEKDKAVKYLKDNLSIVETEEYVDESLRDKYIWALKSIQRLDAK
ncbi:MAG: S-layer homology domain-containing protein [Clostridiaceae bacterium]|nr:S-layer homology domain-containing protein [Clostridiaceae bacterium]